MFCSQCDASFLGTDLFQHIEQYHVGTRPMDSLYEFSCGECGFVTCERNANNMIQHIFRTKHRIPEISFDWEQAIRKEARRVTSVIEKGVQILQSDALDRTREKDSSSNQLSVSRSSSYIDGVISDNSLTESDSEKSTPSTKQRSRSLKATVPNSKRRRTIESGEKWEDYVIFRDRNSSSIDSSKTRSTENTRKTEYDKMKLSFDVSGSMDSSSPLPDYSEVFGDMTNLHDRSEKGLSSMTRTCRVCDQEVSTAVYSKSALREEMLAHGLSHSGLSFWKCSLCLDQFESTTTFQGHGVSCNGELVSLRTDGEISKLREHLRECFPNVNFQYEISHSKLLGSLSEAYERPVFDLEHRKNSANKEDCHLCPRNEVKTNSNKLRHALTHSGLKLFKCVSCSSRFTEFGKMKRHARSARGKSKGCDGELKALTTSQDIQKVRETLLQAFPDYDWDREFPPGIKVMGVQF